MHHTYKVISIDDTVLCLNILKFSIFSGQTFSRSLKMIHIPNSYRKTFSMGILSKFSYRKPKKNPSGIPGFSMGNRKTFPKGIPQLSDFPDFPGLPIGNRKKIL